MKVAPPCKGRAPVGVAAAMFCCESMHPAPKPTVKGNSKTAPSRLIVCTQRRHYGLQNGAPVATADGAVASRYDESTRISSPRIQDRVAGAVARDFCVPQLARPLRTQPVNSGHASANTHGGVIEYAGADRQQQVRSVALLKYNAGAAAREQKSSDSSMPRFQMVRLASAIWSTQGCHLASAAASSIALQSAMLRIRVLITL